MRTRVDHLVWILLATIVSGAGPLAAQVDKKVLTMADYGRWRTVTATQLSGDGNWITFDYRNPEAPEDAPDERNLRIRHLASDKVHEIQFGTSPAFSDDSKWVAYTIDIDRNEAKKLRKQKKPVEQRVQLLNLRTGDKRTWKNATSFTFSKRSNALAIAKPRTKGAEHNGHDLIIHDLERGTDHHLGSVASYEFNKPGTLLAYTRDAADQTANGLYVMDLASAARTPLDQDAATYSRMTWDEGGTAVAVLKGNDDEKLEQRENELVAFTALATDTPMRHGLSASAEGFPKGLVISDKASLSWNTDTSMVFFGVKQQEAKPGGDDDKGKAGEGDKEKKDNKKKEPRSDLDVWHWQDAQIQSVQRARARREANRTFRSVFHLDTKRFVQLADETMKDIAITRDGKWGVGSDDREYVHDWKPAKADYYRVDTSTGERQPLLTGLQRSLGVSPDSRHFAYWQGANVWVCDLESGNKLNVTKDAGVSFVNAEYDYPTEKPPYGLAGWTKDGSGIVLNHRYDIWLQPLSGGEAINLTSGVGAAGEIRLRYISFDREERFIDLGKPMVLSAYGQWTKKSGFYRLDASNAASGSVAEPERLVFDDKSFGRLRKAKHADRFMVTIQTFRDCPNYYVADGAFENLQRITDANPHQAEYHWGHRVLFDYTNKDGVRLQGALAVPDTRKPGERLPMLVSFYEKTSQYMHVYERPRYATGGGSHLMEMISKGYLFLLPDVHFNTGATGDDMRDCVEAAVDKAIELGYADPDRVGLCGHSFSGYGSAYIAARSKKFAAACAGAGVYDYASDFNHLWGYSVDRKQGSGRNAHRYDINGQGRSGTSPHENFALYRDQSPIAHVEGMTTPMLLMQGESDNTVAWIEAIGLYNAMRFNGKSVILLSYPDEGHGLSKRVNRIDLTRRMIEFFDHHLMGKPAPDWMTQGVRFLDKSKPQGS